MTLPEPDSYVVFRSDDTADIEHAYVTDAATLDEGRDTAIRDAERRGLTLGEWEPDGAGLRVLILEHGEPSSLSYEVEAIYD